MNFSLHYDSVWPFFVCVALLLGFASTPLFRSADTAPDPGGRRMATLDGLRGFLALAVVFHHAVIYHRYLLDGIWQMPESTFYVKLGPMGVALFFMITGFLFWSRLIRTRGRPGWTALYVNRVFRIGPLYLAAGLAVFLILLGLKSSVLPDSVHTLLPVVAEWLLLGAYGVSAVHRHTGSSLLLEDLTWTLQFEWFFYLSLPVLALFARRQRLHLPFVLGASAAFEVYLHRGVPVPGAEHAMVFLFGMLTASLREDGRLLAMPDWLGSSLVVVLLGLVAEGRTAWLPFSSQLMLAVVFYLVVSGVSLFGLLVCRPAIRLGDISYGVYLLQGLALAAIFRPAASRLWVLQSPWAFWLMCLLATVFLAGLASVAHRWIEQPGIRFGKRVVTAIQARVGAPG